MQFQDFALAPSLLEAVERQGYTEPTPIQQQAIAPAMAGSDLLGCAQTGTGKTAAFALPILHRFLETPRREDDPKRVRALILAPTRELAAQIEESFLAYGEGSGLRSCAVYGGVRKSVQVKKLRGGVDVLIATPGRLMDMQRSRMVKLDAVEIFVLDEADRMMDMGFIDDIRKIERMLPRQRQTMMFSATIPPRIESLSRSLLNDPVRVAVSPEHRPAAETVRHSVYYVESGDKRQLLSHLIREGKISRALVFTRTKSRADQVTEALRQAKVTTDALHSDRQQHQRERALENFRKGKTQVLVASDIASRGLDVEGISHVINFDLPEDPETYVHRIGRTGRAGNSGEAMSFCGLEERGHLSSIERLIQVPLEVVNEHPYVSPVPRFKARTVEKTPPSGGMHRLRRPGRRKRL
jgi:ATP-dependent RNA helicase RhlE